MARFLLLNGPAAGQVIDLPPGAYRVGRDPDNAIQVDDPSVSGRHCELIVESDELRVVDLGSSNGTRVNGSLVESAPVLPGQTIELGALALQFEPLPAPASPAVGLPTPPRRLAPVRSPPSRKPGPPPVVVPRTFWRAMPGIVSYPFQGNGPLLLGGGAVFFAFMEFLQVRAFLAGLLLAVISGGYLFAYLQNVIVTSAQGEPNPPPWPDFTNWWDDILRPYLHAVALVLVCLGPAFLLAGKTIAQALAQDVAPPEHALWTAGALGLAGLLYLPMALLATAMADSLAGLNPFLVLPSMTRVPGPYLVTWIVFCLVIAGQMLADAVLDQLPVPVLPAVLSWFLALVLLLTSMRLLGLLYWTEEERLGWGLSGRRR